MTCPHEDFVAVVDVNRIDNGQGAGLEGLAVDVRVRCVGCDEPLVFRGLPIGQLPSQPCMSVDGTELRIPARVQSHDPHFGLGLPGFVARVAEGDRRSHN